MSAIPFRNLYVMLAYASRDAGLMDDRAIGACDFERPLDLLARLLDACMRRLRRRGIDRVYVEAAEHGPAPRGAIAISATVTQLLQVRGEVAWTVDDLLPDTEANRVVKAALRCLMGSPAVSGTMRQRLRHHLVWLAEVGDVSVVDALRLRPRLPRALPEYRGALRLARLALEHLLPDMGAAGSSWHALSRDVKQMGALFEAFVRGFAAFELRHEAVVSVRHLEWDVGSASESAGRTLIPTMKTDVFIEWKAAAVTVCECKFYGRPLVRHRFGAADKLNAEHMYQLFAYLQATQRSSEGVPSGLLLYALTDSQFGGAWVLEGFPFRVATVDLSAEWQSTREELIRTLRLASRDAGVERQD